MVVVPGFLFMLLRFHYKACFGILQSSILITCPSHLSLHSLIISPSFAIPVLFLTSDFYIRTILGEHFR